MIRFVPGVALILFTSFAMPRVVLAELDLDTAAAWFGQRPAVWGMRLSPDGQKVSFLQQHPADFPIGMVVDLKTGKANLAIASDPKKGFDLTRCLWANDTRLLCGYYGVRTVRGSFYPMTRLAAVNTDGKDIKVLAQRQQRDAGAFGQDEIVDLLPDDPDYIWIEVDEGRGEGVSRVDIYKNRLKTIVRAQETVWGYASDGRGEVRLRLNYNPKNADWQYRLAGDKRWYTLHRFDPRNVDDEYQPVGFRAGKNEVLVEDDHEGRIALFSEELTEDPTAPRKRELLYSHDEVDVSGIVRLGKFRRGVGVAYRTDKPYVDYFDEGIRAIAERVGEELPGLQIRIIDESWDRRFYLIHADSDQDSGAYYRFDAEAGALSMITRTYPWLEEGHDLAEMRPVHYPAEDGVKIPGYVTLPERAAGEKLPLIVLPHGGPSARDVWGFDWLTQFFAARGYAVLQANYRGSSGYGADWEGDGAFRRWETVVGDIHSGVDHLVSEGVVDPDRVCAVGWSFGGYAALMSALVDPDRYRCVVSIAGVTHPYRLFTDAGANSYSRQRWKRLIPREAKVITESSPLKRAKEMKPPVLLLHGEGDLNVPVDHSQDLAKALKRADRDVEYVEYENVDHFFGKQKDRIDLFQRVGDFLDEHLAKTRPQVASQ